EHQLDAAVEVAGHPVGRGEEDLGLAVVEEIGDPRVFEVLVKDADDADVLGDVGNSGPEAADAADQQVDLDAGDRGLVERFDDLGIDQRVHLGDDSCRAAGPGVLRLALDQRGQRAGQVHGGDDQLVHLASLRVAGQQVEHGAGVLAVRGAAGEIGQIGVELPGGRIIVAGAEVNVTPNAVVLA